MLPAKARMQLLTDQNVPEDVVKVFRAHGHHVLLSREVFRQDSPDPLIALGGALEGLIIVTHDKDFKRLSKLLPQGFRGLDGGKHYGRIQLACDELIAAARVDEMMTIIEAHYGTAARLRKRLMLQISQTGLISIDNAPKP